MTLKPLVISFALGAGLMYILDPERGRRRRARVYDRFHDVQERGLRSTLAEHEVMTSALAVSPPSSCSPKTGCSMCR